MRGTDPGSVALSHTDESVMQGYLLYVFLLDLDDLLLWKLLGGFHGWHVSCDCSETECI